VRTSAETREHCRGGEDDDGFIHFWIFNSLRCWLQKLFLEDFGGF